MTAEKAIFKPLASEGAKIIGTVGYAGGSEVPVFNKTYTTDGTGGFSNWYPVPGDVAALVRLSTADRSSKNHPVYLFSYYHATAYEDPSTPDNMNAGQRTAMATYHASWITGFSDGAVNHIRCRPSSTSRATGALVEALLTHRDLPR